VRQPAGLSVKGFSMMNVIIFGHKIALIIKAAETRNVCSIRKLVLIGSCW
jgi:hypothetical protein